MYILIKQQKIVNPYYKNSKTGNYYNECKYETGRRYVKNSQFIYYF